jgi:glutamyl-tRNA synthetase
MSIRVRFAPSPTGALHIGGIRTALFNWLLAKKLGGTFILRIEDTDQTRFVEGAEEYIVAALKWCGIEPTEGIGFGDGAYAPYRQSERRALYQQYVQQLLNSGAAYYAFDTPEQLEKMRETLKGENNQSYSSLSRLRPDLNLQNSLRLPAQEVASRLAAGEPHVIRLKVPENEVILVDDIIRGEVRFHTQELDDKVLMKADGMPTYHLANIVDDYTMKISHVIRGEEWLPSAGHHVLLYRALGWAEAMPRFAHLPLILRPEGGGKLSKRDGEKFGFPVFPISWKEKNVLGFDEAGFSPEAVINFLALLGWNGGDDREIYTLDELAQAFSLERIHKAGARFDYAKAQWFNQQYITVMPNAVLAEKLVPLCAAKGYTVSEKFLTSFAGLMKERVVFMSDFLEKGFYFFEPIRQFDTATILKKWKPENRPLFDKITAYIAQHDFTDAATLEADVKHFITENGLKIGDVLPMLRIALAGTMQGPAVFEMALVLGKQTLETRLNTAFNSFDKTVGNAL